MRPFTDSELVTMTADYGLAIHVRTGKHLSTDGRTMVVMDYESLLGAGAVSWHMEWS